MMVSDYQNRLIQLLKEYPSADTWIPCTSVLVGILACKLVYDSSKLINAKCVKHYSSLPRLKQVEWDNRVVSTVHAVIITALAFYVALWSDLYSDDQDRGSVLYRSSAFSTFVLGVSVGYFISDISMILWFYPALGGMEYGLHHLLSMTALAYAMLFSEGQFYVLLVLLSETTTPGINLRWYLDAVGMKKSKLYVVNGVAVFFTWLVARIFLFMYVFYHIYSHFDEIKQLSKLGFYLTLISPCVLGTLNVMWFVKITKGMIKTLAAKRD